VFVCLLNMFVCLLNMFVFVNVICYVCFCLFVLFVLFVCCCLPFWRGRNVFCTFMSFWFFNLFSNNFFRNYFCFCVFVFFVFVNVWFFWLVCFWLICCAVVFVCFYKLVYLCWYFAFQDKNEFRKNAGFLFDFNSKWIIKVISWFFRNNFDFSSFFAIQDNLFHFFLSFLPIFLSFFFSFFLSVFNRFFFVLTFSSFQQFFCNQIP